MKLTIEVSSEVLARLDALVPGKQINYEDFVTAMFLAGLDMMERTPFTRGALIVALSKVLRDKNGGGK